MRKAHPLLVIVLALVFSFGAVHAQQKPSKPNIVFILADDFGFSSLNSYGAEKSLIRTPHIDRIAEEGTEMKDDKYLAELKVQRCNDKKEMYLTKL